MTSAKYDTVFPLPTTGNPRLQLTLECRNPVDRHFVQTGSIGSAMA
jgi:hypothetical protein